MSTVEAPPLTHVRYEQCTPVYCPAPSRDITPALGTVLSVEGLRDRANQRLWDRACTGVSTFTFDSITASGEDVAAQVTSDSGATYQVTLSRGEYKTRDHGYVASTCTCPASKDGSSCKHSIAFGLHLLGYRPEHEPSEEPDTTAPDRLREDVASLPADVLVDILTRACATHPDIAALVQNASARSGTFDDLLAAARAAVDAVLDGYDYDRRWRYVGSAVANPLNHLLEEADPDSAHEALAVALAGLYALNEYNVHDRYGDLTGTIDAALVAAHANHTQLTDSQRERLANELASLACKNGDDSFRALFGIEYYDPTDCGALMPALVGDAGRAHIVDLRDQLVATARKARTAAASSAVARTREAQVASLNTMADRCGQLLDLVT